MAIFGLNLRKQNSFFRNHKSYFFFYHIRLLISQTNKKYHTHLRMHLDIISLLQLKKYFHKKIKKTSLIFLLLWADPTTNNLIIIILSDNFTLLII